MLKRTLSIALFGLLAASGVARAQPASSPVVPTIDNPNRHAVTGLTAARRFFQLAASRRVDIAVIGDSNTRQLAFTGHEDGMGRAFAARFGMYATRVDPLGAIGSRGAECLSQSTGQGYPFQSIGAPLSVENNSFADPALPSTYVYLPQNLATPIDYNIGLQILPGHPIDITAGLRYHFTDMPIGAGSYNLSVRPAWPGNAFTNYASGQPLATHSGQFRDLRFDVPAGPRDANGLLFCFADLANGRRTSGPLAILYQRVENPARSAGIAYSPFWFMGGQSARGVLSSLFQTTRNEWAMREWFRQTVRLQNAQPVLLVHILHGGNDFSDYGFSLGPAGTFSSDTPEGQEDNTRGIIEWMQVRWNEAGYDPANLFFLLGPYHPREDRLEAQQGYEAGWRNIVTDMPSQVFTLAGTMMSTPDEFRAKGFNRSIVDEAHLMDIGYQAWARTTVKAIDRAICPPDYNSSGVADVADIFDFLNAWFAGVRDTDVNYSGLVDTQDIFDFLNLWFTGC